MDKKTIYLIWAGGAVLALLIYLLGPDRVLTQLAYWSDLVGWRLRGISGPLYNLMRALAIAALVVFWALGLVAVQRRQRGIGVLLLFTLIFWWLVGGPMHWGYPAPTRDWLAALLVAGFGAVIMTGRLGRAER